VPAVCVTAGGIPALSVLARLVRRDEAEALVVAEPLDSSCASHPDIPEFIRAEALEEERGRRLVSAGYPPADAAPFWPSSRQTTPSA
jgi:hypothetical protein